MRKVLFITGSLLLLDVVPLLLWANFHAGLALQAVLSVAVLVYAFFFDKIGRKAHITAGFVCCIPLIFVAFLAIYGNIDNTDYNEDALIVLGAGIKGKTVRGSLEKRLDKAVGYYGKNPKAVIVVCGGQGPEEEITEALAMERYLVEKGVPKGSIIREEKSTSTYENLAFAKELLDIRFSQGFSSLVVTSDYHVYRAVKTAALTGVASNHIGACTTWYTIPSNYFREMLAVVKIWVTA